MKRFVSIAVALLLMIPSLASFAASDEEVFQALFNTKYLSGELSYNITVRPNAPLPEFMDPDGSLTGMLSDAAYTLDMKYNTSEDSKKMQSETDMTISLPGEEAVTVEYWIDMDLTNADTPVYKTIMKASDSDKYMYADYSNGSPNPMMDIMPGYIENINALNDSLVKNADQSWAKPEYTDGKYVITLDEAAVKDLFRNSAEGMSEIFMNYFTSAAGTLTGSALTVGLPEGGAEAAKAEYENAMAEFFDKIAGVQLFDTNAIVIESQLDDKNQVNAQKTTINIKTNIAKLMEQFGVDDETVTEENSNLDISLIMDCTYSHINEPVEITYPELNADNSVDMLGGFGSVEGGTVFRSDKVAIIVDGKIINPDVEPVIIDGVVFVPARALMNAIGVSDENIVYQDGNVSVNSGDTSFSFTIGNNTALVDGKLIIMEAPALDINDRAMLPASSIAEAFNYSTAWTPYYKVGSDVPTGGVLNFIAQRYNSEITIMIPSDSSAIDADALERVSEITGTAVNLVTIPIEMYREKVNLIIAAGESCAFFNSGLDKEWLDRLAGYGVMLPLDELLESCGPNINEYFNSNPDFKASITSADGHIYYIPLLKPDNTSSGSFFITNTVKNPKLALKWFDYFYSEEGQKLLQP